MAFHFCSSVGTNARGTPLCFSRAWVLHPFRTVIVIVHSLLLIPPLYHSYHVIVHGALHAVFLCLLPYRRGGYDLQSPAF